MTTPHAFDDTVCWHPAGCFAPAVASFKRGTAEAAACAKHTPAFAADPSMMKVER